MMNNTLFDILNAMGFTANRYNTNSMFWGVGSTVWGKTITVTHVGKTYGVAFHKWEYNCEGDCVYDEKREYTFRRHSDVVDMVVTLRKS